MRSFPFHIVRRRNALSLIAIAALALAGLLLGTSAGRNLLWSAYTRLRGRMTLAERLAQLGEAPRDAVRAWCVGAGLDYPPSELALLAFKAQGRFEIHARGDDAWRHLQTLPILGASGTLGPKLRQGDSQVPEGLYAIESLHPNSRFHLALRVAYPNESDRERARADGRTRLGGDIMIHGGSASIGCIALGDPAIERLFILVADVGVDRTRLLIAPCDLRSEPAPIDPAVAPAWIGELYIELADELRAFPSAGTNDPVS